MINMGAGGKLRGKALWAQLIANQKQWIAEQGRDREDYIANYHGRHGYSIENATIIYEADTAALRKHEARLASCR